MREVTAVLLIGVLLFLPAPALASGIPLTDAQLEEIAAVPEDPEPSTGMAPPSPAESAITSDNTQRLIERLSAQILTVPSTEGVVRIDPTSPSAGKFCVPCSGIPLVGATGVTPGIPMSIKGIPFTINHPSQ